jgi:dihydrofolate reductase
MGKVRLDISMSLDGFTAGPNVGPDNPLGDGGERLHDWMFSDATETGRRVEREVFDGAGAVLMGRRVFDLGKPHWGPETFRCVPVFVVTHRFRESMEDPGGSTFTFVTEGIEHALAQARSTAGDHDVVIIGGAVAGRQLLLGGFVDELRLHLVHIVLGAGTRLFEPPGAGFRQLTAMRLIEDAGVTHFTFDASAPRARS